MRFFVLAFTTILFAFNANAEMATIVVKDGTASVTEIIVPENHKVEFKIHNLDENFEEVKSKELNLKIEAPLNSEITVSMPAMKPGVYPFKVDFKHSLTHKRNHKVIEGKIIVK